MAFNYEVDEAVLEEEREMTMLVEAYPEFMQLDKNNDSLLNFEEFKIQFANISESVVASVFKKFDQVFKILMRPLHLII